MIWSRAFVVYGSRQQLTKHHTPVKIQGTDKVFYIRIQAVAGTQDDALSQAAPMKGETVCNGHDLELFNVAPRK